MRNIDKEININYKLDSKYSSQSDIETEKFELNNTTLDVLIDQLTEIDLNTLYYMIEEYNNAQETLKQTIANNYYTKIKELANKYKTSDIIIKILSANTEHELNTSNNESLENIKNSILEKERKNKQKTENTKSFNDNKAILLDDIKILKEKADIHPDISLETIQQNNNKKIFNTVKQAKDKTKLTTKNHTAKSPTIKGSAKLL